MRRAGARLVGATAGLALGPAASASAHGLGGAPGVRVPGFVFGWVAALVLVASFLTLKVLWTVPRLEGAAARRIVGRVPVAVDVLFGAIGVGLFCGVVYAGIAGTTNPNANIAPSFVYIALWVALVPLSLLFGDVFAALSPWRAVARAAGWAARGRFTAPRPYPPRLGHWPAVVGLLGFAWLELVFVNRDDPRVLAVLAVVYLLVQLAGMARYGEPAWTANADTFGVVFGLYARLSVFERRGRELWRRPLLSGATGRVARPGTVTLVVAMIGATAYDGLSSTSQWAEALPGFLRGVGHLGLGPSASSEIVGTLGLALAVGVVAGVYRLGIGGVAGLDPARDRVELSRAFAHTLIPIAAGYAVAHYFTFLVFQGQGLIALASDPLGHGSDLFGTAGVGIDRFLGRGVVWYAQVGALVAGHVAATILAHDRALVLYGDTRDASRSQAWMLTAMVGFTGVGLWLLASIR